MLERDAITRQQYEAMKTESEVSILFIFIYSELSPWQVYSGQGLTVICF